MQKVGKNECRKAVQFMKVKRLENLDAKMLARIDKMWNVGNPKVRTSEKVGPKLNSCYAKFHFFAFFLSFSHNFKFSHF